jgi:multiple sugar transport system permease protein
VEGASETWIFRKVVFPLLTPTVLALLVLRGVDAFKLLDIVFITQGGPNSATETISYYIYETFFILHRLGYGAALTSFVTFVVELPVILFLLHSVLARKRMVFQ